MKFMKLLIDDFTISSYSHDFENILKYLFLEVSPYAIRIHFRGRNCWDQK